MSDEQSPGARLFSHEDAAVHAPSGGAPAPRAVPRPTFFAPIVTWIERTYHRRRRQARLGRLTPIEYETTMTPAAIQAA